MRRLPWILAALAGVLALLLALALYTPVGLQTLWRLRPAGVDAQALHGRLAGPLQIEDLRLPDGTRVQSLRLDWRPLALLHGTLHIRELAVQGLHLPAPGGESAGNPRPPALPPLPLSLQVDRLTLDQVTQGGQTRVQHLQARLSLRPRAWRVQDLVLVHPQARLEGDLRLAGSPPHDLDGRLDWRVNSDPPLRGESRLDGNLRRPRLHTRLGGALDGEVTARIESWPEAAPPRWHLEARLAPAAWQAPPLLGGNPALRLRLAGQGAEGAGTLDLASDRWTLHGRLRLDPRAVDLAGLDLRQRGSPLRVRGEIHYPFDGQPARADLAWQALRLPQSPLASPAGRLQAEGTPADYRLRLHARLSHPRLPLGQWTLTARGDPRRLRLEALQGALLRGRLTGEGEIAWEAPRPWRLRLEAQGLDPASLPEAAHWPGSVDLRLRAEGGLQPRPTLDLALETLSGTLRDQPLSGQGRVRLDAHGWQAQGLRLGLGEARLQLDGRLQPARLDARLHLTVPRLALIDPRLDGTLTAQAELHRIADAALRLRWRLQGRSLHWRPPGESPLQVDTVDGEGTVDGAGPWRGRLVAGGLRLARLSLDRLQIQADGEGREHRLRLAASNPDGRLQATAQGRWEPRPGEWTGRLTALELEALSQTFRLPRPAPLRLSAQAQALDGLCLEGEASGLCLSARRDPQGMEADLDLRHLPLPLAGPWLPPGLALDGRLHGRARLRLPADPQAWPEGRWRIDGEGVRLRHALLGEAWIPLEALSLQGETQDGRLQSALEARGPDLELRLHLPRLDLDRRQPARSRLHEAELHLRLPELRRFAALAPAQAQPRGPLRLDARLDGPLADPLLDLEGDGQEAALELGLLGITLREARLQARGRPGQGVDLQLRARSDRPLVFAGRLDLPPRWRLAGTLQGERVEVARRPDLHLFASPRLAIEATPGTLAVGGELGLPQGEIMPQQAAPPTQVVAEPSEDVVVIDGQTAPPVPAPAWTTRLDLDVVLGERVFFQGYGLSAHAQGRLHLSRNPQGLLLGTGELIIKDGSYEAYGQSLEVRRGRLTFAASPLDNPAVDLLAVRTIGEVTVGLQLSGRLKKPQLTLFADPPMNETAILSYLLFGHAPGEASGPEAELLVRIATSLGLARGYLITRALAQRLGLEETRIERNRLVLGRRLGERLYLNYAIGLGAEPNLWIVRYRLDHNWELKAEAGAGYAADLFWTLDR